MLRRLRRKGLTVICSVGINAVGARRLGFRESETGSGVLCFMKTTRSKFRRKVARDAPTLQLGLGFGRERLSGQSSVLCKVSIRSEEARALRYKPRCRFKMAAGYLGLEYFNALIDAEEDLSEEEDIDQLRIVRRRLRDFLDPFTLPEIQFKKSFRLSRVLAWDLCNWLRPALEKHKVDAVSVERQVLTAVRFYATGCNQEVIGRDAFLAVSQPIVSRCIKNVTSAINNVLFRECVKFPSTQEERAEAKRKFATSAQPFENAIGAIDCTHVGIIAPVEREEDYYNHHQYHSLNVQMVCDASYTLLQVCARYGGSRHDAFIWNASPLRHHMLTNYQNGERDTYLIGDTGYPLEPWLLIPIKDAAPGTPEFRYTEYHCKARSIIERCYGIMKAVWICLSKRRILWYGPVAAGRIINACAVLHNLRLRYNMELEPMADDNPLEDNDGGQLGAEEYEIDHDADPDEPAAAFEDDLQFRQRLDLARDIRAAYIQRHFQ